MHIITLNNISASHAGREIFRDVSWAISDRDRIGLVGPNGAGKSTLLNLLRGAHQPDSGQIARARDLRLGYLPQDVHLPPDKTLLDIAMTPPPRLAEVEDKLANIEAQLADPTVYSNPQRLAHILDQQEQWLARYQALNGPRHASAVRELLALLGFSKADYDLPSHGLSGGQKKLALLIQLAVELPDLLLLDEPDNHLDVAGKRYLERFIQSYRGAVVIISHDRYLLDEVAQDIAEIEQGRLTLYKGNYSAYMLEKTARRQRQQQLYVAQQKRIAQIEANIHEWEQKARADLNERFARQARSRRRMLERMEEQGEIIARLRDPRRMALNIEGWRGSTNLVALEQVAMAFGDNLLFYDLNLLLRHGDRIGLVGPNGVGKSVLFKLILGRYTPLEGRVKIGPSVSIGYYSQEHQTLENYLDKTPIELIRSQQVGDEASAVAFLLKMLFSYEQTRQPIRAMSGGERSRLQLALLMLARPNLLLLDEPTNNLDIPSVEALEEALTDFDGALLTISHDRYFLDRVVDNIVALEDGRLHAYSGGYSDYLAKRQT